MPAGRENRACCSQLLLQPFARGFSFRQRCTRACVHALPSSPCFAENASVPARHSTRTSLPPSTHAQDRNVFAVQARTLGWEMPRDKSRLLDQYSRSLKFQDPVPAQAPSCNAAACFPEQPGWRQLRGAGCRGCWWDGSGPPQKPDTIPPSPAQKDMKSQEEMIISCGLRDRVWLFQSHYSDTNQFNGSLPFLQQEKISQSVVK